MMPGAIPLPKGYQSPHPIANTEPIANNPNLMDGAPAKLLYVHLRSIVGGRGGRRIHAVLRLHPNIPPVRSVTVDESPATRRGGGDAVGALDFQRSFDLR